MKKFTIWFEIFGKKMKTTIEANNESEAKQALARKIIFHKIETSSFMDDILKEFEELRKNLNVK